jgi:phosphonate metabolism-associated iron-containing alcohol dehydrogenase
VLALGGGASIDLAKAVCHRTADRNPETLVRWIREAGEHPKLEPLDLVAVPTTAGTGSEVTRWATLWDLASVQGGTVRGVKRSLESESGYPVIAVIDPLQTLTCPIEVTRDSGLDALSHALEALWNLNANPISDQFAIRAARLILSTLPDLLSQPSSTALRESMSLGALMAGLAFSQTRTALAHALSYPLTIDQGIPHGLACAIWLPTTMKLALGHSSQRDSLISSLFDSSTDPVSALSHWLGKMSVPEPRAALGTPDIEGRIAAALSHPRGRNFIGAHLCEPHTT